MSDILRKLGLIDYLTTELEIEKGEFAIKLSQIVDKGSTGLFSGSLDLFSSGKKEYRGKVSANGFEIRRRRSFFDTNMNLAIAKGYFVQKGDKLIINTEIKGFYGMVFPFYLFLILFYSIFIIAAFFTESEDGFGTGFSLIFLLLHACIMFGLPYFILKRSTSKLKHDLEREFYYLTRKNIA